jgi:2-polyprenyl-6-methoxyphenol hydroxylase-like FAD-dependent oxidoreductase
MKNILVSGASIAGPTLAYWLHRYGFHVTVVERAPAIREGGYAVDVRGAALDVLDRMGLLAHVRRENTDTLATSFVDQNGKRAATMDRGFGVIDSADVEIMRGDFVRILYAATNRHVNYLFSDVITSLEQRDDGVHVTFERNAPRTFDLVVGADGLHSNVRRLAFGDESQFIHHLGSYMAIFSAPNHMALDRWQLMFNLPGRVVSIKTTRGNAEVKVTAFFSSPPIRFDYRDLAQQKRLTAEAFADAGWEMPRLLAAMYQAPDFYFDSTSQIRMPNWSRGRVTLLGDACVCPSPLTGQGTSLALVGAYVLAGELAHAAGDHEVALARYEMAVRAFAERNQASAAGIAKGFAPQTPRGIWWRNLNFKLLPYIPWRNLVFNLVMRGIANAAKAITLSDYSASRDSTTP